MATMVMLMMTLRMPLMVVMMMMMMTTYQPSKVEVTFSGVKVRPPVIIGYLGRNRSESAIPTISDAFAGPWWRKGCSPLAWWSAVFFGFQLCWLKQNTHSREDTPRRVRGVTRLQTSVSFSSAMALLRMHWHPFPVG
jgi:hypothetical protein